jgi:hypothetical protein
VRFLMATSLVICLAAACSPGARAQDTSVCDSGNGEMNSAPPRDVDPESAIQKFTANEAQLKKTLQSYSFSLDILIQSMGDTGPNGEYHRQSQIIYDGKEKPQEKITFNSVSTLKGFIVLPDDIDDARDGMLGALTPDHLSEYVVRYLGQQAVDELKTLVFDVAPKKEKKKGLFQGQVWVDDKDFVIVKTCGQIMREPTSTVINRRIVRTNDVSPVTATYRELIDGKYWFPTYSRADGDMQFANGSVYLRETVKRQKYTRAGT